MNWMLKFNLKKVCRTENHFYAQLNLSYEYQTQWRNCLLLLDIIAVVHPVNEYQSDPPRFFNKSFTTGGQPI